MALAHQIGPVGAHLRTFAPLTLDGETQSVPTAVFSLNPVLPTCCGHHPWGRRGWFCQNWQTQTPSQWEKSQHPALQRRGPCAPWPAVPGTSCHTCRDWWDRERKKNSALFGKLPLVKSTNGEESLEVNKRPHLVHKDSRKNKQSHTVNNLQSVELTCSPRSNTWNNRLPLGSSIACCFSSSL